MPRVMEVLLCRWIRPHHFIILMGFCLLTAFVTAYSISVSADHVHPLLPYISETGTTVPESCIFGLFLNIGAVLAFITMFIRHENFANNETEPSLQLINNFALLDGFFSALGLCIVANFQEKNILSVHMVGAVMTFGCGVAYCWLHAYLTYKCRNSGINSNASVYTRILIAFFVTIFFALVFIGASVAGAEWSKSNVNSTSRMHWDDSDPGYSWHLVSTFSEWLMSFCFIIFFFTFYNEFRAIRMKTDVLALYNFETPRYHSQSPVAPSLA